LWLLAIGALVHSAIHFTEAYGLWHQREWAEWFALLSGASYLPGELYSLLHYASRLKWSMLVANAVVVLFMLIIRLKSVRHSTRMLHALTNRKPYSNVSVGLRAVAVLESVKGIVVLLVGFAR